MTELNDLGKGLAFLRENPIAFVELMDATPEQWQREAFEALQTNNRISIRSGHGIGKTAFLSWVTLWQLLTHYPTKVACTANTSAQLYDVLWAEVSKWHRRLPKQFQELLEIKSDRIELRGAANESFAVAKVSRRENPEALQGLHSENLLFVIDEASGIDNVVFEVAEGSMSTPHARTILCGNPTRSEGYFYETHTKMRHRWKTMKVPSWSSSQVSDEFVEDMKIKYGEESNVFRVRVAADFPEADDDAVMALWKVEAAVDRDVEATGAVIWGLDVSRTGKDRCALAKRHGNTLLEPIKSWQRPDLMVTVGMVVDEYDATYGPLRPEAICVDTIGLGAAVADRLRELGYPAVDVNVSENAAVKQRFMRLRDELWWKAKDWFDEMDCKICKDEELISELTMPRYSFTSSGKIKVESKDELRKRARSPDLADAFILTFVDEGRGATSWASQRPIEVDTGYVI